MDMYETELEHNNRSRINGIVLFCVLVFCSFRVATDLLANEFRSAAIIAAVSGVILLGLWFSQKKNFKGLPVITPFLVYIAYLLIATPADSFKYFYDLYLLTLIISVTYFSLKNYVIFFIISQIVTLLLSIFVLPSYAYDTDGIWIHFLFLFGAGIMLLMIVQFAVRKSNAVSRAFASFGALMKITPNVLILVDGENRIKYISQSVYRVFGIKYMESLIGKNFLELFNEEPVKELFNEIARKCSFYESHQKISVNGLVKTFDVFADKMSDETTDGMFFMLNDISEIVKLKELAEHDSLMDSLVQVPNRRALDRNILEKWSHALRDKVNLSFLMIDIDFFKKYNDTYGHRQGDELLKTAGEVFKRSLKRSTDFVARFGGEEFAVLLYATNSYQANVIAERIRSAVENEIVLTTGGEKTHFTVSIGVATIIPNMDLEYDYIVEEADKALYKAKQGGRNRVWVADLS